MTAATGINLSRVPIPSGSSARTTTRQVSDEHKNQAKRPHASASHKESEEFKLQMDQENRPVDFEGATPNSIINQSGFSNSRSRSRSPTMADALNIEIDNYVLHHNRDKNINIMIGNNQDAEQSQDHALEPVNFSKWTEDKNRAVSGEKEIENVNYDNI